MESLQQILFDENLSFMRYALLLGLISGIPFGTIGSLVVARRISYLAAAIAHAVLGGIGFSLYAQSQWEWIWLTPQIGALFAGILAALIMGWVSIAAKEREDTVIGAIWSIGMATGLLFIFKTPQYVDPMSYLFGDILLISSSDILLVSVLASLILIGIALAYRPLVALCFDEEFARLKNIGATRLYFLLLCLTAITIVLLVNIVGIVLVIALLTLPAATASLFSRKLWHMMLTGSLLCMAFTFTGIVCSFANDTPPGPTIILITGIVYGSVILFKSFLTKKS